MSTAAIEIDRPAVSTASAIPGRRNALEVLGVDTSAAETTTDVLATANLLGWNVRTRELETVLTSMSLQGGVQTHESRLHVPGMYATVRDNPITGQEEVIGVVGAKYRVQQVEALEGILTGLVTASGGQISHAADYYGNGKQIFLGVDLPTSMLVGGRDQIDHVITCFTSFDGSLSTTFGVSSIRAMCANMRQQVLSASVASFSVRHTQSGPARLAQAQSLLSLAWKGAQAYGEKAEIMISKPLTDATFREITTQIFKDQALTEQGRAKTMQDNRNAKLSDILHGPTNANIQGTSWAGLQAVVEFLEYSATKEDAERTNALRTLKTTGALQDKIAQAEKLFYQYALAA